MVRATNGGGGDFNGGSAKNQKCSSKCEEVPKIIPCFRMAAASSPRKSRLGAILGALVPVKRWELVLQALARLPAAAPVSVIHAGGEDGSPESAAYAGVLRRQAAANGVATRIEWRGERMHLRRDGTLVRG